MFGLILERPELLIEAEEIPFESQTRENKDLAKGESRILQAGKVGRRLKLIEVRQEEGKEIRTEVDAFVEVEAQDQITEVGTKEAEESPLIADMPTPTTPVTPSKVQPEVATLSQLKTKKEKERPVLLQPKTPEAVSVSTSDHPEKEVVKSHSHNRKETSSNRYKRKWTVCLVRPSWSRFLGGGAKFARRKE